MGPDEDHPNVTNSVNIKKNLINENFNNRNYLKDLFKR